MDFFFYRPKHPVKVHLWGGISKRGATKLHIFEGTMNAEGYVSILEQSLMQKLFGEDQYLFMQDNDPKHTSKRAQEFFARNRIEWWRTPPESPDLNPIENLWHELKEYLRRVVKPMTKDQLVQGIEQFWKTVKVTKCRKYIGHIQKVIPKVIEVQGSCFRLLNHTCSCITAKYACSYCIYVILIV